MPRAVAQATVPTYWQIGEWRQLTCVERVNLQCPRIFSLVAFGPVTACDHDHSTIAGHRRNLMRKNAVIQLGFLRNVCANASVAVDAMHREIAWIIVASECVLAMRINAVVDGALR